MPPIRRRSEVKFARTKRQVKSMAKDGTSRGNKPGNYTGAGRKPKPLADKISEGKTGMKVIELPESAEMQGFDMPPPKEYMLKKQKGGIELCADEVRRETWLWLAERGCEKLVSQQLVEQYAMSVSRWIQCEEAISAYGLLGKHPTTGAPIASPFVAMSQTYMKQTNQLWFSIFTVVKENCASTYDGANPQDDVMERLLRTRRGG
jgi:hypothetical protein